jgi:sporadic carbohydrate cluster protein (TIGR04323 family)
MKKSFLILKSLIKKNANFSGIILYSFSMLLELPDYEDIIKKCLKNKINLFFALEEFSIKNNKDIEKLKQIFRISKNTI